MYKFIAPAALAAALVATVAVPTAAQAATTVPTPEIGAVWSQGEHTTVWGGKAELESDARMGIGSSSDATGFAGKRVVVRDDQGREVCDTRSNDFESTGDWECYATPTTLGVGVHTVRATAYDQDGTASKQSAPVRLTVVGDGDDGGEGSSGGDSTTVPAPGPVDQGFTAPDDRLAAPQASAEKFRDVSRIVITTKGDVEVETTDENGDLVDSGRTQDGTRTFFVPRPAAGTSKHYTVMAKDGDRASAPVDVEVQGVPVGATLPAPEVSSGQFREMSSITIATDHDVQVETVDAAGDLVDSARTQDGTRTFYVPRPAAGTSKHYTVVAIGDQGGKSAPVDVEVKGDVDAGGEDSTVVPAPGDVDPGFTHPGAEENAGDFAAPKTEWAYIRNVQGKQHVIAALTTRPDAKVIVTKSTGEELEFTANGAGRVSIDMVWAGNSSPEFTAVAHVGNQVSGVVTVTPTRG